MLLPLDCVDPASKGTGGSCNAIFVTSDGATVGQARRRSRRRKATVRVNGRDERNCQGCIFSPVGALLSSSSLSSSSQPPSSFYSSRYSRPAAVWSMLSFDRHVLLFVVVTHRRIRLRYAHQPLCFSCSTR